MRPRNPEWRLLWRLSKDLRYGVGERIHRVKDVLSLRTLGNVPQAASMQLDLLKRLVHGVLEAGELKGNRLPVVITSRYLIYFQGSAWIRTPRKLLHISAR